MTSYTAATVGGGDRAVSLACAGSGGTFLWILVFKLVVQLIPTSVLTDQCAFQPSGRFLITRPVCSWPLSSILLLGSLETLFFLYKIFRYILLKLL